MSKKNRVSPYWNFVKFYARSKRSNGFNLSLEVADREASLIWAGMADHEREVFAENIQVTSCQGAGGSGAPARRAPAQQRPKISNDHKRYLKALEKRVLQYCESIQDFAKHVFCLAQINTIQDRLVPAEITIVRWSVERGIITYFHVVCDPQISGEEYQSFRRTVGDSEAIVRVMNTTNSSENRNRIRDAVKEFCGAEPLLVQTPNHEGALKSMELITSYQPVFTVLSAEEVFQTLSQKMQNLRLTKDCINAAFSRWQDEHPVQHLKCNLHRELTQYQCSLEITLSMAYTLEEIFADRYAVNKNPISHLLSPGNRPQGVHFSGSGISEEDKEPDYSW